MEHKHSFFVYKDGGGAYCMGCDKVLDLNEISVALNAHYNAPEYSGDMVSCAGGCGSLIPSEWILCKDCAPQPAT